MAVWPSISVLASVCTWQPCTMDKPAQKNLTGHQTDDEGESTMIEHSVGTPDPATAEVSGIYVDTENLTPPAGVDDVEFVQSVISRIVSDWPAEHPPIGLLALYVPADKVSQWRPWASALLLQQPSQGPVSNEPSSWRDPVSFMSQEPLRVRGVQHFSRNGSKNSADLAIVLDAMDDLMLSQRIDFAAVLSNDSDFHALFDKMFEIVTGHGHPISKVPLLWIVAPNGNNLSPEIKRFLPPQFVWDLSENSASDDAIPQIANEHREIERRTSDSNTGPLAGPLEDTGIGTSESDLAILIVREFAGKGEFKSSAVHDIAKRFSPSLPQVNCDSPQFGMYLGEVLCPLIAAYGGRKSKPTPTSSWVYEIPEAATSKIPAVPAGLESIAS